MHPRTISWLGSANSSVLSIDPGMKHANNHTLAVVAESETEYCWKPAPSLLYTPWKNLQRPSPSYYNKNLNDIHSIALRELGDSFSHFLHVPRNICAEYDRVRITH